MIYSERQNRDFGFAFALVVLILLGVSGMPGENESGIRLVVPVKMNPDSGLAVMSLEVPLSSLKINHGFESELENILLRQLNVNSLTFSTRLLEGPDNLPSLALPKIDIGSCKHLLPFSGGKSDAEKKAITTHVVNPGECLWTISKAYGVPISEIMNKNGLGKEIILVGQELKIPIGELNEDVVADSAVNSGVALVFEMGNKAACSTEADKGQFNWPVRGTNWISSHYGRRFHPIYRKYKFHNGIDIAGRHGTPIVSASKGEVLFSGYKAYSGKVVYIKHAGDLVTVYAHCSKLLVKKGQKIKAGQVIAKMGRTGKVTGIHLHFAVKKGKRYLNPMKFIGKSETSTLSEKKNVVSLGG